MKKRILISSLAVLFVVSTIGLPVTFNLCNMAKDTECMMHQKPVNSFCCAKENSEYPVTISLDNIDCCRNEFVYNKVEDEFIYNKTDVNFFSSSENIFQVISFTPPADDFTYNESFYCDSSPPFLINPELHITNSFLLI